jgi:uncharacterized protein (TIGR00730 family)
MSSISTVCVFCGSSTSPDPAFSDAAELIGALLAQSDITLVYGAGCTGMMGALAQGALANGGRVTGITHKREVLHAPQLEGIHTLEVVDTLPQRKARMVDLADAFIILPGGYGTMDEFFEILAWTQVGLLNKPIGLLNVKGFYDGLIDWFNRSEMEKFIRPVDRALFIIDNDGENLLRKLQTSDKLA